MKDIAIDMTGQVFGRLTVICRAPKPSTSKSKNAYWKCSCICGGEAITRGIDLRKGKVKSCNCLWKEHIKMLGVTHSLTGHHLFGTWSSMMQRCNNKNSDHYKHYGGRGIIVCERWKNAENFIGDMETSWKENLTLDRIDNDGNYESSNCRWATWKEQNNNKRS